MNKRGKYTTLNLEEKMKVLSRIEAGRSLKSVMDEFGISKSTFYDIKKNKKLILDFVLKQDMPLVGAEKRKRTTGAKYGDVDDAVYMWYQQKRSAGVPVRGVELQAAAERFAQCFGRTDFKASTGWLFRFRNRHAIGNRKVCAEQVLSSVSENVEPFRQKLSMLIKEEKLCLAQLYSGGETDLFWKSMPENTQASRKDICLPGRKINKECLSALLCANADGTHKLKSIIIGKSKLPKSVKEDTSTLPVIYKPSKDVWFTKELFSEWFFQNFVPEVRHFQLNVLRFHEEDIRALLLLDSSPVHTSAELLISEDGRIKCIFFPHNTSTLIQPMNQGVILSCKRLYRWKQLEESLVIFKESDDEQDKGEGGVSKIKIYNIKSAIFNWAKSWAEVKQITIANAWENLLYKKESEYDQGLEHGEYGQILEKCGELETKLDGDSVWLNGDDEQGSPPKSKDGITKKLVQKGEGMEKQTAEFELSAVRKSLDYLLDFVDATPEYQRFRFTLKEMQQEIIKKQFQSRVHSRIGSFLKPRLHNIKDSFGMPSTSGSSN
ncbi:tigger transposable element-derived protein 7 [Rousettus aegyptiacus]|uniref:Tigger transposable element derived 7 n=1 Tax=Rousettus aegyptiacus TaxID=9407 RepID=A0A7J8F5V1_ROUAE|nr:tigger transposable element-derived protein 7 [Rousettus aegyptiacus]XP_036081669.1 tigger transposable element-derived protein 7 [Rousettus aegyptiacus]XP_036081670.1 tigger transposable element-derived protein 7 [Rousettus aegyptiacus]XP_036081671.1 tigger transposable element-derived protein 7 [Rousettus aegyptiacus]KAF6442592.1 tigger transposable element derived 7 [Rousettus aegyptiacus]